jgi:hypothetical protein
MRLTGGQAFELGRADATVNAHDTASRLPPITDFIGGKVTTAVAFGMPRWP